VNEDQLKFRAWDEVKDEMLYGPTKDNPNSSWVLSLIGQGLPIMQCSTIKDCEKKLVWQGDLIEFNKKDMDMIGGNVVIADVGFKDGSFMYRRNKYTPFGDYDTYLWGYPNKFKVVGNIYQHADLIAHR